MGEICSLIRIFREILACWARPSAYPPVALASKAAARFEGIPTAGVSARRRQGPQAGVDLLEERGVGIAR